MILKRIVKGIRNPWLVVNYILGQRITRIIPDETFVKLEYRASIGRRLNLDSPQSFNEKLQWLKLFDRKQEYTQLADKYKVRKYIKGTIGEEYLIPLLGVYDSYDEIDFEALPNQFVLKPNHTSGDVYLCKDKSKIDYVELKKTVKKWMEIEYYWIHREWPYKNIKPEIICEKFMSETNIPPNDYKVVCFNGKARLVQVHMGRFTNHIQDTYDLEWNKIDMTWGFEISEHATCKKPKKLEKMIELSEQLAVNMCQVRIDWFIVEDNLYFGEITFFDGSGFTPIIPESYDYLLGSWINLPIETNN
ncbi:ATP-grasp fold amidoligase family protein [Acetobacterium sp.]|uniref:ATP-grasp fold amidoligase family protein n=1 Tax=Acetobacterium sp. TaxID=1872094 RepID=UPI002F3F5BEC